MPLRRAGAVVVVAALGLGLPSAGSPASASTTQRARIDVFGDSLSFQASPYLANDVNRTTARVSTVHVYPVTAICDWRPTIDKLTASTAPTVAVLQFAGNHYTSCMSGYQPGTPAFLEKYRSDLTSAVARLRSIGVTNVLVDLGPATNDPNLTWYPQLRQIYVGVVHHFDSRHVVYAWKADLSDETSTGGYVATLPCLAAEAAAQLCAPGSSEVVRSRDGLHFCPTSVGGADGHAQLCPTFASGAYRYALGLAQTVWSLLPRTKPLQFPLLSSLSTNKVPPSGGVTVTVRGAGLSDATSVLFEYPLPNGQLGARGVDLQRLSSTSVSVIVPNLARQFGVASGSCFVSVVTPTAQSPWLGLDGVEVAF